MTEVNNAALSQNGSVIFHKIDEAWVAFVRGSVFLKYLPKDEQDDFIDYLSSEFVDTIGG